MGFYIKVRVRPSSSMNRIKKVEGDIYFIDIKAPPEGGKANKELIKFLSKEFKVPKERIRIIKGEKSRNKLIKIEDETPHQK